MEKANKNSKIIRIVLYILFAITVFYLLYQTPYCHDEWHWGLEDRFQLMLDGFDNYNGRYLGNLFILLITRSTFWKVLLPALCMIWLLRELERGTVSKSIRQKGAGRQSLLLLLCIFLLASLPSTLYAQSYGWLAAFTNFVPPVILFLVWFNWTDDIYSPDPLRNAKWKFLALPLGIATQLFCEHVTIFVVIYALWTVFFTKVKKGKFCSLHLYYLAGAILGAAIMFSNGAYSKSISRSEGFKSINLSLFSMFYKLRDEICDHLFLNNWILILLLTFVLLWLMMRKGRRTGLDMGIAALLCIYAAYSVWHFICPEWGFVAEESLNNTIELLLAALFALSVLLGIFRTVDPAHKWSITILYVSSMLSAAPLMAANPIGARCFYFCYVLQCLTVLKLFGYVLEDTNCPVLYPTIAAASAIAILGIAYVSMFSEIGSADRSRAQIIEGAKETDSEEIILPRIPYSNEYIWTTEPTTEDWLVYFKEFYGIPENVNVIFQ